MATIEIERPKPAAAIYPKRAAVKPCETLSRHPSPLGRLIPVFAVSLLAWMAYQVAYGKYYTPRTNVGFYLGVTGSLMMLALLAYPLRKHVRWMQRWGALKHWFRVHMILGIVGPTLILFHSTFHIRSTNAAVALISMLGVVISGIIGRFVYTKIHFGLYGSRATMEKIQEELSHRLERTKPLLHLAPRIEPWLQAFERHAMHSDQSLLSYLFNFLTIGMRRGILELRCARELRGILRNGRHPAFRGGAQEAGQLIALYLREIQRVAQFSTYERFFSLWHVLHIPLIYILAASTVFHIVAVYMY